MVCVRVNGLFLAVNLYGELKFGNIYVKIEGSIDFFEV